MEELIDVLDKDGNKTGEVKTKSEIKRNGDFHRAISVCIVNDRKEILMQKRSKNKKCYPNLWSIFVKGHIRAGETSLDACVREVYEELGISINCEELKFLYSIKEEKIVNQDYIENIFFDTFLLIKDIEKNSIIIQDEELEEVEFISYIDFKKRLENGDTTIVPNQNDYDRIFMILDELNV